MWGISPYKDVESTDDGVWHGGRSESPFPEKMIRWFGEVHGLTSDPRHVHSSVSVRKENGTVCDVGIQRLDVFVS